MSAPPELRHPAAAGPCRTPPAPFRGQSVGARERSPPPLEPPHAGGVFPFAPGRAGRREQARGGGPGDLVAGAQGLPPLPLVAPPAFSAREQEEEREQEAGRLRPEAAQGGHHPAGGGTSVPALHR